MIHHILFAFFLSALWCFGYRCRGGPLSVGGDFRQRLLYWVAPIMLGVGIFAVTMGFGWYSLLVAFGSGFFAYVGLMFGHANIQNGTTEDFVNGVGLGIFNLFLMSSPIMIYAMYAKLFHVFIFALLWPLSGAWQGISYWIGNKIGSSTDIRINGDTFLSSGVEWAEFLTPLLPAICLGLFGI